MDDAGEEEGSWPAVGEGTETIVFFTFALAFNDAAAAIWWVMAAAVLFTAIERVRWAMGALR